MRHHWMDLAFRCIHFQPLIPRGWPSSLAVQHLLRVLVKSVNKQESNALSPNSQYINEGSHSELGAEYEVPFRRHAKKNRLKNVKMQFKQKDQLWKIRCSPCLLLVLSDWLKASVLISEASGSSISSDIVPNCTELCASQIKFHPASLTMTGTWTVVWRNPKIIRRFYSRKAQMRDWPMHSQHLTYIPRYLHSKRYQNHAFHICPASV